MKKSFIWIIVGVVLIALIVGGYFYFKASADVVSGPSTGSTDVTLKMENINYETSTNIVGTLSIVNNTTKSIPYMRAYIPTYNPSTVIVKYKTSFFSTEKQTSINIIGLNGYLVNAAAGGYLTANNTNYTIAGKYITTSGSYKVFPLVGYSNGFKVGPFTAGSGSTLEMYFKKNFTSSPVTVTASVALSSPNVPAEGVLAVEIAKTQLKTEKTMTLYVPKNIGTVANQSFSGNVILNYDNRQDIAIPISNPSNLSGYEVQTTFGSIGVMTTNSSVEVPVASIKSIGDYITFPVYPVLTVPALANGEKYRIFIDYKKTATDPDSEMLSCATVAIYSAANYGDATAECLTVGNYLLSHLVKTDFGDNNISSVTVAFGYKAILYDGDNFTGASVEITADTPDLSTKNFNDKTSSLKVVAN